MNELDPTTAVLLDALVVQRQQLRELRETLKATELELNLEKAKPGMKGLARYDQLYYGVCAELAEAKEQLARKEHPSEYDKQMVEMNFVRAANGRLTELVDKLEKEVAGFKANGYYQSGYDDGRKVAAQAVVEFLQTPFPKPEAKP